MMFLTRWLHPVIPLFTDSQKSGKDAAAVFLRWLIFNAVVLQLILHYAGISVDLKQNVTRFKSEMEI